MGLEMELGLEEDEEEEEEKSNIKVLSSGSDTEGCRDLILLLTPAITSWSQMNIHKAKADKVVVERIFTKHHLGLALIQEL